MEHPEKRVAIIGGTGLVGRHIAKVAMEAGYQVRMLVRNPQAVVSPDERIELLRGDAENRAAIDSLLQGCSAVINAFGRPPKEPPRYSAITAQILESMRQFGVRRYVGVTGASLDVEGDRKSVVNRIAALAFRMLYPEFVANRGKELELLRASGLDWTLVRLPLVVEGKPKGRVKESLTNTPGTRVSNLDAAQFLVGLVGSDRHLQKTPLISN